MPQDPVILIASWSCCVIVSGAPVLSMVPKALVCHGLSFALGTLVFHSLEKTIPGASLVVQCLRLCTSIAVGVSLIPAWGSSTRGTIKERKKEKTTLPPK